MSNLLYAFDIQHFSVFCFASIIKQVELLFYGVFSAAILDVLKSLSSIAFLAISDRSAILDVRNAPLITFLTISDRYGTSFGGHFGWDYNVHYRTRPRYLDEQCMCQVWRTLLKSFKSYRGDNKIMWRRRRWRKENIPENVCFSGI